MSQPYNVQLTKDKIYAWCSCGKTSHPPFCDGSHSSDQKPVVFKAKATEIRSLCFCQRTGKEPFCDGSHTN